MRTVPKELKDAVEVLPELYQPIYGYPDLSARAARTSADRFANVCIAASAMQQCLGRPLRVLDLGCAQGFFSLGLAVLGHDVVGIDEISANIGVCRLIAREYPDAKVDWVQARVQDYVREARCEHFDIVLGLSVFHHVCQSDSLAVVQELMAIIAGNYGALLAELALRAEPMYWAESQPEDEYENLSAFTFVSRISQATTHLSGIKRPLYFASSRYWYVGAAIGPFESCSISPYGPESDPHHGTRRYFHSRDVVVKRLDFRPRAIGTGLFSGSDSVYARNRLEFSRELALLSATQPCIAVPALIGASESPECGLIAFVREPGRLLSDIIVAGDWEVSQHNIIQEVLTVLTELEHHGLFHDDVRAWNVLVDKNGGVRVIDLGSVGPTRHDCAFPNDPYLAWMVFVHEVVHGVLFSDPALRVAHMSPFGLPAPYEAWLDNWWRRPRSDLRFADLLKELPAEHSGRDTTTEDTYRPAFAKAVHETIATLRGHSDACQQASVQSERAKNQYQAEKEALESAVEGLRFEANTQLALLQEGESRYCALLATFNSVKRELNDKASSLSYAIARVELHEQSHVRLNGELTNAQSEVGRLTKERDVLLRECEAIRQEVSSLSQTVLTTQSDLSASTRRNDELVARLEHFQEEASVLQRKLTESRSVVNVQDARIQSIYRSRSWRLTRPLRRLSESVRFLLNYLHAQIAGYHGKNRAPRQQR